MVEGAGGGYGSGGAAMEKVEGLRALLKKAKLESKLAEAEAWCEEMGADSVSEIKLARVEDQFVASLKLKMVKANILRQKLGEFKVEEPSERLSVGDVAVSSKI